MHLLIDGDIFRYRIGFVCQTTKYYVLAEGEEQYGPLLVTTNKEEAKEAASEDQMNYIKEFVVAEPLPKCLHSLKLQLKAILDEFELDHDNCTVYLSGKDNFRDRLVDYYKANRDRAKRPIHYQNMTEYMQKYWPTKVVDGIEADDAMGIDQSAAFEFDEVTCICSLDKDLDCIPGWHYNFVNHEHYWIDEVDANRNFFSQMITGDTADNIPGLYKMTGQRALGKLLDPLAHLEEYNDMWMYVWNVYWRAFLKKSTEKGVDTTNAKPGDLLHKLREIGQLLWIWRSQDDLWNIPTTIFKEMKVDL